MGKSTNASASLNVDGAGSAKKRVTLRRKAAKKGSSSSAAKSATVPSDTASAAAAAAAPASAASTMSRDDRKKLIAAARAQGLLPAGSSAATSDGTSGVKHAKIARAKNPNSRRRPRGTRRAVVNEEGAYGSAGAFMTPAEERMAQVHAELEHFDTVVQTADFVDDPFAAVSRHLTETMATLKPLTPDVGRLPE